MISIDQRRAAKAWNFVSHMDQKVRKEYYSVIRSFPSMVQSMGIGQSVAFLMAKGKPHHKALYEHLTGWLFDQHSTVPWTGQPGNGGFPLFERLVAEQDPRVWWYADEEAIQFSLWLKRFAEAFEGDHQ